jgi:16S rRNA (adenine1518-N6/adenine1519-N6)-dimethyltransferase
MTRTGTRHRRGPRRRKRFGQHFLGAAWAQKVVEAIAPAPGDVFLEIGAGRGALTLPLAASGCPILAVEIDRDLVRAVAPRLPPHVTLLSGDFLHMDVLPFLTGLEPQRPPEAARELPVTRRFRVVGNLPYNLSSPILLRLVELQRRDRPFTDATLMLQREVGDRLAAHPGTKAYGALTVFMHQAARATTVLTLPPGAFTPRPRVRSSLVRLTFGEPAARVSDEAAFERLVRALFSARRKTLANALRQYDPTGPVVLALSGLDGRRRPETLQVTEMARLAELFAAARRPPVL